MQIGIGFGVSLLNLLKSGTVIRPDIATTPANSMTSEGQTTTWTGSTLPVGQYHGGEPFALTSTAVSITQTGIASVGNQDGAMYDPFLRTGFQGFDILIQDTTNASGLPFGNNQDAAVFGPKALAINAETTLVKSLRKAGATVASWQPIDKYVPFTFLPASKAPKVGDIRPSMASPDKISRININDVDFGCCRSLDLTGMGFPTVATLLARWRRVTANFCVGGGTIRVFQVFSHVDSTNYSAQYASDLIGDMGMLYHASTTTNAERLLMAEALAPVVSDIAGQIEAGYFAGTGEGQHEFYHACLAWGAAIFNSTYLYNSFQTMKSNLDQVFWWEAPNIGQDTSWPSPVNQSNEFQFVIPAPTENLGKGGWESLGKRNGPGAGSQLDRTYANFGGSGKAREDSWFPVALILANRSMPNGLGIMTGQAVAYDNTAPRTAMLDIMDQYLKYTPQNQAGVSTRTRAAYGAFRSLISPAVLARVPNVNINNRFTPGAAGFVSWDYAADVALNAFSSTPITGQDVEYSQDNIQFVNVPSVAATDTLAVPAGIKHYFAIAFKNAQGRGRRSYTVKEFASSLTERGAVTPTGTPTGAVVCTVLPELMKREFEFNVNMNWYVTAGASVPAGTPMYFGSGIWTGAITGNPTLQLQREATLNANDWGNIAGVSPYVHVIGDPEKRLRLLSTRNGVTATSAPVLIGSLAPLPANTWIDTEFGNDFRLYHPNMFATPVVLGGNAVHDPGQQFIPDDEEYSGLESLPGWFGTKKTGANPSINMNLFADKPGVAGDYRITFQVPVSWVFSSSSTTSQTWNSDGSYRLSRVSTTPPPLPDEIIPSTVIARPGPIVTAQAIRQYTHDFTIPGGYPDLNQLWLRITKATATSGASGGAPGLSKLSLIKL